MSEQSPVWGYGGPCDSGVLVEEGDGAVIVGLVAVSRGVGCRAQPICGRFLPPHPGYRGAHAFPSLPLALGTAPPDAGSSVFWGSPVL